MGSVSSSSIGWKSNEQLPRDFALVIIQYSVPLIAAAVIPYTTITPETPEPSGPVLEVTSLGSVAEATERAGNSTAEWLCENQVAPGSNPGP